MTLHFDDMLDLALERQLDGAALPDILRDFPDKAEDLGRLLPVTAVLAALPPAPLPAAAARQADRQAFLAEVEQMTETAVSPAPVARLKGWIVATLPWSSHQKTDKDKENYLMSSLILKAALALVLFFGAAGGTAAAAADSLPGSPVYPLKIALEDTQLAMAGTGETAVALHTDLAAERLHEMEQLALADHVPADATLERLQYHLDAALNLAAQLPEQTMSGALLQIQEMVQTRTRAMDQVQAQAPAAPQAALTQAQTMLQNAGELAAAGLQDPQTFRHRNTINRPSDAPIQPEMTPHPGGIFTPTLTITPSVTISATQPVTTPLRLGPCASGDCGTPQGNGPYGPGRNGPQPEETAVSPGPGAPQGEPTPGTPGDCSNCGDGNQYGPQPEDSGNGAGMPGGSPDGVPVGGQSQNGPQYQAPDASSSTSSHSASGGGSGK